VSETIRKAPPPVVDLEPLEGYFQGLAEGRREEREACARLVCWRCANGMPVRRETGRLPHGNAHWYVHDVDAPWLATPEVAECLASAIWKRGEEAGG
jgi:hypothetical protein